MIKMPSNLSVLVFLRLNGLSRSSTMFEEGRIGLGNDKGEMVEMSNGREDF